MSEIDTSRTDHLLAKTAHAAEIAWVAFRFDDDHLVAVETGERIGFLMDAAGIKRKCVAARPEHYCSSK